MFWVVIFAVGCIGAVASQSVRTGTTVSYVIYGLLCLINSMTWLVALKKAGDGSMARISLIYDAVYMLGYFGTFLLIGEALTTKQGVGAVLVLAGLYFLH